MTPIASPQYTDLVTIQFQDGDFASSLVTNKAVPANATIVEFSGIPTNIKRYTSVQVGAKEHIELGNEFVYMNHSCDPSVLLMTDSESIKVLSRRALQPGEALTFDYCATEWDMDQAFTCSCASLKCRREIRGSKYLPPHVVSSLPGVNQHIQALKKQQQQADQ